MYNRKQFYDNIKKIQINANDSLINTFYVTIKLYCP
jgi:hypothetical protein